MSQHHKSLERIKLVICAFAGALLLGSQSIIAQDLTNSDLQELRKDIQQLKSGQRAIELQLQEITKLLSANSPNVAAAQRPNPALGATMSVAGKPVKGDPNARLTLIEFADYECPFCGRYFRDAEPQIMKDYISTGKMKYIFSDLPLPMHPYAKKAAEAALCAGEQGKYWEMHDLLFANQGALEESNLVANAGKLGLDIGAFQKALDSGKYSAQVQAAGVEANKIGFNGAPSFAIGLTEPNSPTVKIVKVIVGAQPYASFQQEIEGALNPAQPATPQNPAVGATVSVAGKQFKGSKDAKLTVIQYSDYECSYCTKEALETYPQLEKDYINTGKLKFVFSDLVLDAHPHATKAAEAALCAADQGRFWEMHDLLFANQEALEETNLVSYAATLGLDAGTFQQCLDANQYEAQVKASGAEARRIGLNNTPITAIGQAEPDHPNNVKILKVVVGANGYAELKAAVEEVLNAKPAVSGMPMPSVGTTISMANRPFKGDAKARVTLVKFADYECPSCARFALDTEPQILKDYVNTGKLKYVFVDLPLPIHREAGKAAEAALCAGDQGKFWEMHDAMFANQSPLRTEKFSTYADKVGLDPVAFNLCLDSKKFAKEVYRSFAEAQRTGFVGTPSFALGQTQSDGHTIKIEKVIVGAQNYAVFQEAINNLLNSVPPAGSSSAITGSKKL